MSAPLRVLLVTDAFPPVCGGSGWSTFELARGLSLAGHHVDILKIDVGFAPGLHESKYQGLRVTTLRGRTPDVPVVRNLIKNERMWQDATEYLVRTRLRDEPVDILHAQHVMSTVPAIRAGQATDTPVVATVRDYWPVCYWSDLIHDPDSPTLCPGCSVRMMTRCVLPRAGGASVAAWSVIPYMRRNLSTKRRTLAGADAVIAVSSAMAGDLRQRAPELATTPMYTIPNAVDMTALAEVYERSEPPLDVPYVLYVGKLAINKGVQFLVRAMRDAAADCPLVVVGDGPRRGALQEEAHAAGVDLRELGWRDRHEVWRWMRHATALLFPSYGPESLSRVLIEAAALGTPIAAMDTGGTRDILHAGTTALLSTDPAGLGRDLGRLLRHPALRASLGEAARADVAVRFATPTVVARIEQVYRSLLWPDAA
jgi:glycosyltransferase involved in cell wall biosynthesis